MEGRLRGRGVGDCIPAVAGESDTGVVVAVAASMNADSSSVRVNRSDLNDVFFIDFLRGLGRGVGDHEPDDAELMLLRVVLVSWLTPICRFESFSDKLFFL